MEASKCTKMGPSIIRMIDLKIKPDSINGKLMFRAHRYQVAAFISMSVKKAIEQENISGCEIRLADGWNDTHLF